VTGANQLRTIRTAGLMIPRGTLNQVGECKPVAFSALAMVELRS